MAGRTPADLAQEARPVAARLEAGSPRVGLALEVRTQGQGHS